MTSGPLDVSSLNLGSLSASCHDHHGPLCSCAGVLAWLRVTELLARYFDRPPDVAAVLRRASAVISGSSILSVVSGGSWQPRDLDLVVSVEDEVIVNRFLRQSGYKLSSRPAPKYPRASNFHVKTFTQDRSRQLCSIDVTIVHTGTPVNFIRSSYHISAVMNYFDGDCIVVMHPLLTFAHQFAVNVRRPSLSVSVWVVILEKYAARGFVDIGELDEEWEWDLEWAIDILM